MHLIIFILTTHSDSSRSPMLPSHCLVCFIIFIYSFIHYILDCSFPSLHSSQFPTSSPSRSTRPFPSPPRKDQASQGYWLNITPQDKIRPGTKPHVKAG